MSEIALAVIVLALLAAAWSQRGKWRERARAAEEAGEVDEEATRIQNSVASDPAYRERVRRRFDRP